MVLKMYRLVTKADRLAARYVPENASIAQNDFGIVYAYESKGVPYAIAYRGTAGRSEWHTRFRSFEQRSEYIEKWLTALTDRACARSALKEQRKAFRTEWKVGTVLSGSWGYEQTNVEFWQVVELSPSGKTAKIRELVQDGLEGEYHYMTGKSVPALNVFTGRERTVRVQTDGRHSHCHVDSCYLSEWDGRPKHWTAYA